MTDVDKSQLYGEFQKVERARNNLGIRAAHKSLDIPFDDMNIKADKTMSVTNNGVGIGGLLGVAAAAGIPSAILAGVMMFKDKPVATPTAAPVETRRYAPIEYRWHVADGKKVEQYRENGGEWKAVPPGGIVVNPIK